MTTHQARPYQTDVIGRTLSAWQTARNVLLVLPTGSGKSYCCAAIVSQWQGAVAVIAHRSELVSQMALALAREGVRHRVIGQAGTQRGCVAVQMSELKRSYVEPNAKVAVCSVQTLVGMQANDPWLAQVTLWVQDEAHHLLAKNQWGRACAMFPNAYGLGVTATPMRADGHGLGRHADGLMDAMVVGPSMRDLINQGYLSGYRVFAPPSDIDLTQVNITASGDYSPPKLSEARRKSHITGDVVAHYLRIARGKLGVTFDVDIESATETAQAYRDAGVPAEVVTSKTPDFVRAQILRRFREREILQLVNVDLFGEGFDLPAIEVVSMARPTQSYGLYVQQFGRACRVMDGKDIAIVIDHVGNVMRHGVPDAPRRWTLDRRERRTNTSINDAVPIRLCANAACLSAYERALAACPYCGTPAPPPASRSAPEHVDGDLEELDPAVLAALRGEIARVDGAPAFPRGAGPEVVGAIKRRHWERQQAQAPLRATMQLWGGWMRDQGHHEPEAQRRFFYRYGIDVGTAQTLGAADANELRERIQGDLAALGVTEVTGAS